MKILVYFREHRYGGVHTYLKSQVRHLVQQGHEVWVSHASEATAEMFRGLGARTFSNKEVERSAFRFDKDILAIYKTFSFLRKNRIECIFSHTSKGGSIARIAGFLAGTRKRIHVIHGFSFHEFSPWIHRFILENIERLLGTLATHLVSVNHSDRDTVVRRRLCPPSKIKTVVNGIPMPDEKYFLSPAEKSRFLEDEGFKENDRIILFVGRLMVQKNPLHLINAFSKIEHKNTHLVLVGEGPLEASCQKLSVSLGVGERVHLKGFRRDVPLWYQVSHLFVLPSLWEGLPMTLIEAMSYGSCCIASNIKGNRECITSHQDGILVPPHDADRLSAEMNRLLTSQEDRKSLSLKAKERASAEFSEDRMLQMTHEIIIN